jgi:hypothetical protein
MIANPRKQLNQVLLVEQVVLEPQNQLLVRLVTFDHGAPLPHVVNGIQRQIFRSPRCPPKIGGPAR